VKFAIVMLCSLILLLLAGVLPVGKGLVATAVYTSPVTMLLFGLLCVSSIRCCFKSRSIGFLLVHLGIVIILAGAFIGYTTGKKGGLQLQLFHPVAVSGLPGNPPVSFGFEVAAKDFEVDFYPPVYHLYRPLPPDQIQSGQMPFKKVAEVNVAGKERLDLEEFGFLAVTNLKSETTGEWVPRRMLASGAFLHLAGQTPSHYGVTLQIVDGQKKLELPVRINHPAGYKGWRFYLMSYDQRSRSYVVLSARRDPGRNVVIAGLWSVIIGTFIRCFRRAGGGRPVSRGEGGE
jgi:hypothetical protein